MATLVLVLFELYLRREVTYVVHRELAESRGLVEQSAEFLVTTGSQGRRLVPNADVIIKNHFTSGLDVEIKTNSLGLRHRELQTPKPANELRVLILGDSTTVMDYLPDAQTYVRLIEQKLQEGMPGRSVQVINAGIGNIGTEEQLQILREVGPVIQPDIVLLAYYLNDSRPPWGFSGEVGDGGWLRRHSLIADTIYRRFIEQNWQAERRVQFEWIPALDSLPWRSDHSAFLKLTELAKFDWGAGWVESEQSILQQHLREFSAEVREQGASPLLAIFPPRFQVEADFVEDLPQRVFAKFASELSIPSTDLLPLFRNKEDRGALFYDHCHVTANGAEVIAQALTPAILAVTQPGL